MSILAATEGFSSGDVWMLVAVAVLIAFTAFLALSETAFTRTNRVKALTMMEEGRPGAKTLVKLLEHPERTLNPVLLLLLVTTLVAATLVGIVAEHVFGSALGIAVATVFEIVIIFVFAEAAPKTWAVQHSERAA